MKQRILTLRQILSEGTELLMDAGVPEAALDAWLLLSSVTGISKAVYYGNPDKELTETEIRQYFSCIEKRSRRIPLQHITGEQEFMGCRFRVNEHVLIPRQDTETLVEEALKIIRPGMRILDMCTGSGCILLSLLKMSCERKHIEGVTGIGADISADALFVAKENAVELLMRTASDLSAGGAKAEFVQSDLFEKIEGKFDLIISNPPYIPTAVIEGLQEEVRLYDPYIALDGKEDGLYFYREIIKESVNYINPGGHLMFEIGCEQGKAVAALMEEAGYQNICIKKDLSGLDRVVTGM